MLVKGEVGDAYACESSAVEYSSLVSSKNGFLTKPPAGLKIDAASGESGNCFSISSKADFTLLASETSVLMPMAFPPLELISWTSGSKLLGVRDRRTTEYSLAKRRAMEAPCGFGQFIAPIDMDRSQDAYRARADTSDNCKSL